MKSPFLECEEIIRVVDDQRLGDKEKVDKLFHMAKIWQFQLEKAK